MSDWRVYILLCSDGSFYTGITTDVERRLREHNHSKLGARYTRSRRPVKLVFQEKCLDRSDAGKAEYRIRKLTRTEKQKMVKDYKARKD